MCARAGDNLHFPFQCDECWFRNIKLRTSRATLSDNRLLEFIRRVNLDGMWSREPSTVRSIKLNTIKIIKGALKLGMEPQLPEPGPWPIKDEVGFQLLITMLDASLTPGNNQPTHLQFDTIRKQRTSFSHLHEVSAVAHANEILGFRNLLGKAFVNSSCPTQSRFFQKVMEGMLRRMGRQTKSNMGIDYQALHIILNNYEWELGDPCTPVDRKRKVIMYGTFFLLEFVLSLRSHEGFLIEAHGLISHLHYGTDDTEETKFVLIPLLGRFKNEDGERWHLMMSCAVTASGFKVRKWVDRLVRILVSEKNTNGPAFCDTNGKCLRYADMDEEFQLQVEQVQMSYPNLIEPTIDVREWFSIFRSLRRGSTARVGELDVSDNVVNLHNRWRTTEGLKGSRSTSNMRDYYTSLRLTRKVRLKYTSQL